MLVGRFIALDVGVAYVRELLIAPFFVNVAESCPSARNVVGILVVVGNGDSSLVESAVIAENLPDLFAVVCPADSDGSLIRFPSSLFHLRDRACPVRAFHHFGHFYFSLFVKLFFEGYCDIFLKLKV